MTTISDLVVNNPNMLVRVDTHANAREIWTGFSAGSLQTQPYFCEFELAGKVSRAGKKQWTAFSEMQWSNENCFPGHVELTSEGVRLSAKNGQDFSSNSLSLSYTFGEKSDVSFELSFLLPDWVKAEKFSKGQLRFDIDWRQNPRQLKKADWQESFFIRTEPSVTPRKNEQGNWVWDFSGVKSVVFIYETPVQKTTIKTDDRFLELKTDNPKLDKTFLACLETVRTNQFASGVILADLFHYRDAWLRDGTYAMMGLALAGGHDAWGRFVDFWVRKGGFSVGGEREAQQPAIFMTGLWYASQFLRDGATGTAREKWDYFEQFGDYYERRVNEHGGMIPTAEEWICFVPALSSWPNSEIYSGLITASKTAQLLGKKDKAQRWSAAAQKLQADFLAKAYDTQLGRFIPLAGKPGELFVDPKHPDIKNYNGPLRDTRVDAGMLQVARLEFFGEGQGIVAADDPRFLSTEKQIYEQISDGKHGIDRFGPNPDSPHQPGGEKNPWPQLMCWSAQLHTLRGDRAVAWQWLDKGILQSTVFSLEKNLWRLPEFWTPGGQPSPASIFPWSCGELVTSVIFLFTGLEFAPEGADIALSPWLPQGMNTAELSPLAFKNWELSLKIKRDGAAIKTELSAKHIKGDACAVLRVKTPQGIQTLSSGQTLSF